MRQKFIKTTPQHINYEKLRLISKKSQFNENPQQINCQRPRINIKQFQIYYQSIPDPG
jgi:LAS superfamily LD-carboxypeptidase LdcB